MASTRKKRPTGDQVKGLLLEGNFGGGQEALPLTDPVSTTQLVLKLDDIKLYDRNPRRERNPAYDEIKASIRSKKQLNNHFNVTRRPGDDLYMVESGGNTRLMILKELYRETGDEAFNTVHCLFVPWKSEAAVLSAHLIENEMRGDMMLIDKAYAAQELKKLLEEEQGETLSDREFIRLATETGYKISRTLLGRFNYALKLDQMIPTALRDGMGGQKLDEIRKVENAYRQFCVKDEAKLDDDRFDAAFMAVMAASENADYWSFREVRDELDERLSELTGVRENLLRITVDAIIDNTFERDPELLEKLWRRDPSEDRAAENGVPPGGATLPSGSRPEAPPRTGPASGGQGDNDDGADDAVSEFPVDPDAIEAASSISPSEPNRASAQTGAAPRERSPEQRLRRLQALRRKNLEYALKIAKAGGVSELVYPAECGMGFYLEGFPEKPDPNHPDVLKLCYTWWVLLDASEQYTNHESHQQMWRHTRLFYDMENDFDNCSLAWMPVSTTVACDLLHNPERMSDVLFTTYFRLVENCRIIRAEFSEDEIWQHDPNDNDPSNPENASS